MRRVVIIVTALGLVGLAIWAVMFYEKAWSHGDRMAVEAELSAAANAPGGPDYQRQIDIMLKKFPDNDQRKLDLAATRLSACEAKRPPCVADPRAMQAAARADLEILAKSAAEADVRAGAARWLKR